MSNDTSVKALQRLSFPEQNNSLHLLSDRFDQHLNVLRDAQRYFTGKECLDAFTIGVKIIHEFANLTMKLHLHRHIMQQLSERMSEHSEYNPSDYQAHISKGLLEADNIVEACIAMMDMIDSWVPEKYKPSTLAVDKPK